MNITPGAGVDMMNRYQIGSHTPQAGLVATVNGFRPIHELLGEPLACFLHIRSRVNCHEVVKTQEHQVCKGVSCAGLQTMLPKFTTSGWLLLVILALAAVVSTAPAHLKTRQTWTGTSSSEFTLYGCRPVIFIYARETIGPGNLVGSPYPRFRPYTGEQRLTEAVSRASGSGRRYPTG